MELEVHVGLSSAQLQLSNGKQETWLCPLGCCDYINVACNSDHNSLKERDPQYAYALPLCSKIIQRFFFLLHDKVFKAYWHMCMLSQVRGISLLPNWTKESVGIGVMRRPTWFVVGSKWWSNCGNWEWDQTKDWNVVPDRHSHWQTHLFEG